MNKLRQIVLGSIGHEASWHDRTVLDFTVNNAPAHSLAALLNGGGKSSLISLFFSIFRPDRQQFLYRKNGDGATIEDYYDQDVPGYIATEWEFSDPKQSTMAMPGMDGRRHIVGSLGLKDPKGLSRLFFSVKVKDGLGWEQLPHPLGEAVADFANAAELKRWFQQQSHRFGADFLVFDIQKRWVEHLSLELGFNLHDFDIHMRMNAVEGGLVEFLKPLAETKAVQYDRDFELLRIVTGLVLNESSLQEKMSTLDVLAKDLREAPAAKRAIDVLTPVYNKATITVDKSRELAVSQQRLVECASDARLLVNKANERSQALVAEQQKNEASKRALDQSIAAIRQGRVSNGIDLAACSVTIADRAVMVASKNLNNAQKQAEKGAAAILEWGATDRYFPVIQKRKALDAIVARMAAEAAGQTDFDAMMKLGSNLHYTLARELKLADERIDGHAKALTAAEAELRSCEARKKEIGKAFSKASGVVSTITGVIENLNLRKNALRKKYEIEDGVRLQGALDSVVEELAGMDRVGAALEARLRSLSEEKSDIRLKKKGAETELVAAQKELGRIRGLIARYEKEVGKLRESPELSEVAGVHDIFSEYVQEALRRQVLEFRKRLEELGRQRELLDRVRSTVEEFGVSGIPQHVRVVADFFKIHAGAVDLTVEPTVAHVSGSQYYDSEILKQNPALAYSLICSDPEKCREFWGNRTSEVQIDLPVFLIGVDDLVAPAEISAMHAILPADHWMDVAAANTYMGKIGGDIAVVDGQISAHQSRIDRFESLGTRLIRLGSEFSGDNSYSVLKEAEQANVRTESDAKEIIQSANVRIKEIEDATTGVESEKKELARQRKSKEEQSYEISFYLKNDEPTLALKVEALKTAQSELEKVQSAVESIETLIAKTAVACAGETGKLQTAKDSKAALQAASDAVIHFTPITSDDQYEILADISGAINEYKALVSRHESSTFGTLVDEEKAAKNALDEAVADFNMFESSKKASFDQLALETKIRQFDGEVDPRKEILAALNLAEASHGDLLMEVGRLEQELKALVRNQDGLAVELNRLTKEAGVQPTKNFNEMDDEEVSAASIALAAAIAQNDRDIADATRAAKDMGAAWGALKENIQKHEGLVKSIKQAVDNVEEYASSYEQSSAFFDEKINEPLVDSDFEKAENLLVDLQNDVVRRHKALVAEFDITYSDLKDLLHFAREVCREIPPHAVSEKSVMLDPEQAAHIAGGLKDMIGTYRYKLDSTTKVREQANALLLGFIRDGQRLVRYMSSEKNRLPHSIQFVSGKQILVSKKRIARAGSPEEAAREGEVCERILDKIADGDLHVLSGLELSSILMREMYPKELFPKGFDFHLVKMSDLPGSDYVPLAKMQFSGGEKAVSAFFLYLLVQNVRSEFYNETMGKGGYIILDNPFANVTRADFIRAITEMATQANYQIIAFTGIKDPSLVPYFKKHIFLTTKLVRSMGREKKVVRKHDFEWRGGYRGAA